MKLVITTTDLNEMVLMVKRIEKHAATQPLLSSLIKAKKDKCNGISQDEIFQQLDKIKAAVNTFGPYFTANVTINDDDCFVPPMGEVIIEINPEILRVIVEISEFQISASVELAMMLYPAWLAIKRLSKSYESLLESVMTRIMAKSE
jgi:hypothetical protein